MNCTEFVEFVLADHFDIKYNFPKSQGSLIKESKQIKENLSVFTDETLTPTDGDLVLMNGKRLLCHVGLFVRIRTKRFVLHSEGRIKVSSLHDLNDLPLFGYKLAGFYKWRI